MLFHSVGTKIPVKVNSDLSALQYAAVKLSSGIATCTFTKGDPVLGIIQDAVKGTSTNVVTGTLQIDGITRALAGGTIAANAYCIVDTDGALLTDDAANQFVVGQALEAAVAGDFFSLKLILAPTVTA